MAFFVVFCFVFCFLSLYCSSPIQLCTHLHVFADAPEYPLQQSSGLLVSGTDSLCSGSWGGNVLLCPPLGVLSLVYMHATVTVLMQIFCAFYAGSIAIVAD